MHIFPRKPKQQLGAYYFGEFDETPRAPFSISTATLDATYTAEQKHYHKENQKVYLTLSGKGILNVGGQEVEMKPESLIQVEPGEVHAVEKVVEAPLSFVVVLASKNNDKIVVE